MRGLLLWSALLPTLTASVRGDEGAPTAHEDDLDCGVRSLCLLLGLQGWRINPREIAVSLPPRDPAGYSMKQLRDEARKRGVVLRGVKLRRGERPAGPSIVFFGDGGHGHYVVARPVGHTGKLVQVLDPNEPPDVIDYDAFEARPRWTGLALVPDSANWPRRVGIGLAGGGVAGLIVGGWKRRARGAGVPESKTAAS